MKIATFNAASVRARLPILVEWLAQSEPDLLAIQETKVENDKFPYADFEDLGYHVAVNGQKSWNGVAVLTRTPLENIQLGFPDELMPQDARILSGKYQGVQIIAVYAPNGNKVGSEKFEYKLKWFDRLYSWLNNDFDPAKPLIILGDINIALKPEDVYDSKKVYGGVGHHPEEFMRLQAILDWGLTDLFRSLHPTSNEYTYWEFTIPNSVKRQIGWRIDHIYGTAPILKACSECWIDIEPRFSERPSDHTFVLAEIDI